MGTGHTPVGSFVPSAAVTTWKLEPGMVAPRVALFAVTRLAAAEDCWSDILADVFRGLLMGCSC